MKFISRPLICLAALLATGDLRAASGDRPTLPSSPVEIVSGTGIDNDFRAVIRRDPNRRITSVTRGNVVQGYVTQTYARGPGGRITSATSTVAGAPAFSYTQHDAQGRRTHVTTNKGTWTYDYRGGVNGDGQVVSATNPGLGDFHYSFDGIGRRTAFTLPGQNPQLAAGNTLNQIHQATWPQSRDLRVKAHPDARVWLNGVEKFSPPNWLDFDGEEWYGIDSPGPYGGWVGWDVLAVREGGGDEGAAPDRKSRKTGHLYFPPAQETFTYDEDGNRTGSARWTYAYDGLNRMTRAVNKDLGTAPEAWDITFSYDAEGRRHGKTARQYADGTHLETLATTWTWDGWHPVVERTVDSHNRPVVERRMVWGPDISGETDGAGGAGGLLLIREKTWTLDGKPPVTTDLLPLHDGAGNIVGLAGADGTLKAEYWYGPFGELIEAKGPKANSNPYRWAGKYHDAETGLVYFGLRYYDPATGQWLSREPLGEGESVNLYAYCHNDPINRVDVIGAAEASVHAANYEDAARVLEHATLNFEMYKAFESMALPAHQQRLPMLKQGPNGGLMKITPSEEEFLIAMNASRFYGVQVVPPSALSTLARTAELQMWHSGFHLRRFNRQAAFLEEAGGFTPGSIDPLQSGGFFDETNPEFQESESRAFWLSLNPARTTALHFHHGRTEEGFLSYAGDVALWSAFSIGGEFISTGRVVTPWSVITGAPTKSLPEARYAFYQIARSDAFAAKAGFSRVGSANRAAYAAFLRNLRSASFRRSNALQGGFAGMDMSTGQIIMGISRGNLNSRFALTHELIHLTRHSKGITPFQAEEAMRGIFRYRAWVEEAKTYGHQFFGSP